MHVTSSDQNLVDQRATFLPSSGASSVLSLNSDVFSVIFSALNIPALGVAAQACKQWQVLCARIIDEIILNSVAFGPKDWSEHLEGKMTE